MIPYSPWGAPGTPINILRGLETMSPENNIIRKCLPYWLVFVTTWAELHTTEASLRECAHLRIVGEAELCRSARVIP